MLVSVFFFFFSSRRRHTRLQGDWSSDVCSSDLHAGARCPTGASAGAHALRQKACSRRCPGTRAPNARPGRCPGASRAAARRKPARSEEHTSELQSPCNLVCRLLLEKKKLLLSTHQEGSPVNAHTITRR